ncbi:hypothetical protein FWP33_08960 [Vibrio parahaemolyticus]|jgi:hypothetical protein|uniref:Uncharacterized protein n=2 Tax=Vibrio harveyi group TaxID=717610 RepID=A0A9Q3YHE4_VIBPH|nr:hypothetical protein [Vibrio parahaemolyticus]ELA8176671.1 hypothetical protein [Vibrio alginolyticus]CAH1598713.1 hypothetical protein THF1C08_50213 [Vibrio jasicida]EGQ9742648.1 hypothetical protein [Vibrio parahaemolyticus]EJC7176110.1 hypothetical protein [Vibrio parahaemolyticus]EJE4724549.1 hypothetical protein [Vibrio parahaemolyticus]
MKNISKKTVTETVTTEQKTLKIFGFTKQHSTSKRVVETVFEGQKSEVTAKDTKRQEVLRNLTDCNKHLGTVTESTKQSPRFKRALEVVKGHLGWLQGMAYGVGGGVLTNILTGTGNIDVNVKLFVASSAVITITGLVKVYFDVQFKDSG